MKIIPTKIPTLDIIKRKINIKINSRVIITKKEKP